MGPAGQLLAAVLLPSRDIDGADSRVVVRRHLGDQNRSADTLEIRTDQLTSRGTEQIN